jgi:hypothetical protein
MKQKQTVLLTLFLFFCTLLFSCKKDDSPNNSNPSNDVSGKIKRITEYDSVNKIANIYSVDYDASGRVTIFKEWTQDSSVVPSQTLRSTTSNFYYNGADLFPYKNVFNFISGTADSVLYTYDAQNRVTSEDRYGNGIVSSRNTYSYPSATIIATKKYVGTSLQLSNIDTFIFDTQNRLLESKFYTFSNVFSGSSTYEYDTKINPLKNLNTSNYIISFTGDDRKNFYKSPNNVTGFTRNTSTTFSYSTVYNYSNNGYPLSGTITVNSSPAGSYKVTYEYY